MVNMYVYNYRWLLLGFKREFEFMDSLRVFEILSSHHLELSSLEAETARRRQQMKEFADIGRLTVTFHHYIIMIARCMMQ